MPRWTRPVQVVGIAVLIMGYLAGASYLTLEVWKWHEKFAMAFTMSTTLLLAMGLIVLYSRGFQSHTVVLESIEDARKRQTGYQNQLNIKKQKRIAELRGDPKREKYISRVERGEFLTDLQIEYLEDPKMRVSCQHLTPVEAALREAGIYVVPISKGTLNAACWIDEAELRKQMPLGPTVTYSEYFDPRDSADGYLDCTACGFRILLLYPNPRSPRFPPEAPEESRESRTLT